MANEIEVRVARKGNPDLDKVGADARKAGKEVSDSLTKGFREAEQASAKASQGIQHNMRDAGEQSGSLLADGLDMAKGGMLAGGAILAGLLMDAVAGVLEEETVGSLLAAQTDGTVHSAAQMGSMAGDVFADNFGESVADVGDAMRAVMQNKLVDSDATEAEIERMTKLAITATDVVGEETGRLATSVRQMLVTDLVGSAEEAMDLIVETTQKGLNRSEDLLDTITEYSTNFRQLGIDGEESLGLISQAMDAGARDTDFAADALKEFGIRAQDMSETTARGFAAVGLDANAMGDAIASGGGKARAALGETLDGLRAIEDPILRNQAAVDLFGTKAEDLADSLFAMDLDTAAAQFDKMAGAAQRAADTMGDSNAARVKEFFGGMKNFAVDYVGGAIKMYGEDLPNAIFGSMGTTTGFISAAQAAGEERAEAAKNAWKTERAAVDGVVEALDSYINKQRQAQSGVLDLSEAQIAYQEAVDSATDALKTNGATLDLGTEKGRDNRSALNDLAEATYEQIEAMRSQGSTAEEVTGFMAGARDEFIRAAIGMGLSGTQAAELATKLKLIPEEVRSRYVLEGADNAIGKLQTIHGRLLDITNREWVSSVSVVAGNTGVIGSGRMFKAAGGPVVGERIGAAASGGARGGWVVKDEQGPELTQLPDGSTVVPAGLSRHLMGGALGAGVDSGPRVVEVRWTGDGDAAVAGLFKRLHRMGLLEFLVT